MGKRGYEFDLLGWRFAATAAICFQPCEQGRQSKGPPQYRESFFCNLHLERYGDEFGHHRTTAWGVYLCFFFHFFFFLVCCLLLFFPYLLFNSSVFFGEQKELFFGHVSCLSALSLGIVHTEPSWLGIQKTRLLSCGLGGASSDEQEVESACLVNLQRILLFTRIKLYSTNEHQHPDLAFGLGYRDDPYQTSVP
ncbi:hypothetical protein E4T39_02286 [Aureobasidium subglaciale]|nr:hypothetical protein E4T39_02286 [Aureobasidium subglaciale]